MNNSLLEALEIITGGKSGGYYIAGFVFSAMAIILSLYLHSRSRNPSSKATPEKFSLLFMFWDNLKRSVASLIVMFLIFRVFDCSDIKAMIGVGFFVALGVDKAIEFLMEKTNFLDILKVNRESIMKKIEPKDETQ